MLIRRIPLVVSFDDIASDQTLRGAESNAVCTSLDSVPSQFNVDKSIELLPALSRNTHTHTRSQIVMYAGFILLFATKPQVIFSTLLKFVTGRNIEPNTATERMILAHS